MLTPVKVTAHTNCLKWQRPRYEAQLAKVEAKAWGAYEMYFVPDAPAGQRGGEGCRFVDNHTIAEWEAAGRLALLGVGIITMRPPRRSRTPSQGPA